MSMMVTNIATMYSGDVTRICFIYSNDLKRICWRQKKSFEHLEIFVAHVTYFVACFAWLSDFSSKSIFLWLHYQCNNLWGSISPTNLCNAQRRQNKVNGAALCHQQFCWNFTPCFRHRFFAEHHILARFCQNAVAVKSIKDYLRKSCLALTPKNVDFWVPSVYTSPNVHPEKWSFLMA